MGEPFARWNATRGFGRLRREHRCDDESVHSLTITQDSGVDHATGESKLIRCREWGPHTVHRWWNGKGEWACWVDAYAS